MGQESGSSSSGEGEDDSDMEWMPVMPRSQESGSSSSGEGEDDSDMEWIPVMPRSQWLVLRLLTSGKGRLLGRRHRLLVACSLHQIPWSQGFSPAPYNESRLSLQWNWYVWCICVRYFCEWYSYTLVNMRVSVPTSAPLSKKNRYQGTHGTVSVIQYSVSPCTGRPGIFHII